MFSLSNLSPLDVCSLWKIYAHREDLPLGSGDMTRLIFTQTMNHSTFHTLFVSEGSVELKWNDKDILKIDKGRSVLIPAVINNYHLLGEGAVVKASL